MGDADDDDRDGKNAPKNFFATVTVLRCRIHGE